MLKPIKITLLGLMAATTTSFVIPEANALMSSPGQQPEIAQQSSETLVARFRRPRRRRRVRIRRRRRLVCRRVRVRDHRGGRRITRIRRRCRRVWVRR